MNRNSILLLSLIALLLSCKPSLIENQLSDVESYIMERPDSALVVLESLDRDLLVSDKDRAHHALLHAMALDKNFIDVADDSLARIAVDYYSEHGPEKYEARALYYLGKAYYYQADYKKAIVEYTKAEEVAEVVDSMYLAMIKVAQSHAYNKSYNALASLDCLREAYEINLKNANDYYLQTSKLYLSQTLYNASQVKDASSMLQDLINDSNTDKNVKLSAMVTHAFINVVELHGDFERTVKLYEYIIENSGERFMAKSDFWAWAYSLNAVGRKEEAQSLIDQLASEKSGTTSYWQYMIAKSNGELLPALSNLEDYIKYNDVEVSDALKQSLALSQRDYFESQAELSESEAERSRLWLSVVILTSIVVLMIIGTCVVLYVRRQTRTKEQYILCINEIRRQLEEAKKDDYPALKRKYLALYKSRFETIGALCEQYAYSHDLTNAERSIYKKVVSLVDEFTEDYTDRAKFESMLDEDLDNIITSLRTEMPSFKDKDFMIFSFLVIGFDVTTIANLLNITANTVYIRKSRMKKQIMEHNPLHKDQYIEAIG